MCARVYACVPVWVYACPCGCMCARVCMRARVCMHVSRYDNEQPFRKAVEEEISSLYKVMEDARETQADLEQQMENMRAEIQDLEQNHEEVRPQPPGRRDGGRHRPGVVCCESCHWSEDLTN